MISFGIVILKREQDRGQQTTCTKFHNIFKNVNTFWNSMAIIIWNPHEKCIQKSTKMPGVGSLIREIYVNISAI